ncbi:MAG: nucleotide exchange factor GrpE [Polyangia bacterium]
MNEFSSRSADSGEDGTEDRDVVRNDENVGEEDVSSGHEDAAAEEAPSLGAEDRVAELERKLSEEHDRLLRTAADLDNFRKRSRREVEEARFRGRTDVLAELLPALDSIDMALGSAQPEGEAAPIVEGMEMVRKQFLSSMEKFGLRPVESGGRSFDPAFHEAVSHVPSEDVPAGGIIEELRRGYTLGDRLLRAAMVVVSSGPPQGDRAESDEDGGSEREGEDG